MKKKNFFLNFFFWGGRGGGGPSPKFNGMILGPDLNPHQVSSKSIEEFFRNTVHKQTNKRRNLSVAAAASIVASIASIAGGGGGPITKP